MKQLAEDDRRMLESLNKAVSDALERKRRLGQYAVIWQDGRPQRINPSELGTLSNGSSAAQLGDPGTLSESD